jgi:hypothetical protein
MDYEFNQMRVDAYHAANKAAELGLTAQDIATMPWDEFNRLIGQPDRPTPAQMALRALQADAAEPNQPQTGGFPPLRPTTRSWAAQMPLSPFLSRRTRLRRASPMRSSSSGAPSVSARARAAGCSTASAPSQPSTAMR